ncbi:MAG: Uma2 family endonuclease [Anaerolineae bacterium]|nr:Uma2 family endonuclease [Anaerolineae bacterium]
MTDVAVNQRLYTEDELMALGSDARIEVIDGEIVEMSPVGGRHHFIGGNLHRRLDRHVVDGDLGYVFMDGLLFLLNKEGRGIKGAQVPDVAYVRKSAMPGNWNIDKPFPGAPTLAVEVMSPDDKTEEVLTHVRRYLEAGTEQVWVVYPKEQELHQYVRGLPEQVRVYLIGDTLDGGDMLPGFTLKMGDVFALPQMGDQ